MLDLVDRYWNGSKSLHYHQKFQSKEFQYHQLAISSKHLIRTKHGRNIGEVLKYRRKPNRTEMIYFVVQDKIRRQIHLLGYIQTILVPQEAAKDR